MCLVDVYMYMYVCVLRADIIRRYEIACDIERIERAREGWTDGGMGGGGGQSEKRTLSRRYLENYFSGVWKSIAGGDNDREGGAEKGRIYRIANAHIRTLLLSLSFSRSLSLSPATFFSFLLFIYPTDTPDSEKER